MKSESRCICIFTTQYLPSTGGVQNYCASLAAALGDMGHRVIVVTCNTHKLEALTTENGIDVMRLECGNFLAGRYPVAKRSQRNKELWRWLDEQNVSDIVINTRFYPLTIQALKFAKKHGARPIVIEHGSAHLTMGSALVDFGVQAVEHFITAIGKRYPADYYAVSAKGSAWIGHFGLRSKGELPNSIDAAAFRANASSRDFRAENRIAPDAFAVAFVGRLVKEKGVLELAQAAQQLDGGVVLIAGDGPLAETLERYEGPKLRLLGRIDRKEIASLLTQADALALPSRSEGFSTTLLEAAACATPALATDVGGMREIAPSEEYGIILESMEPDVIAHAINDLARDKKRAEEMGKRAAERVASEYSWAKTARSVIAACDEARRGAI